MLEPVRHTANAQQRMERRQRHRGMERHSRHGEKNLRPLVEVKTRTVIAIQEGENVEKTNKETKEKNAKRKKGKGERKGKERRRHNSHCTKTVTKTRQHQKKACGHEPRSPSKGHTAEQKQTKQTNANDNKKQPRKRSSGLAGVSSEARLGDGWLVCSVLLLVWPQPKLIMSIGSIFTSPKNTPRPPPPPQSQAQTQPQAPPKPPHIQKVLSSIPPSPPH